MGVRKEPSGRRSVEAEVEVPGTPEEVWAAIATGPGISSWFVPSAVDEREGGAATSDFGPGMQSEGKIAAWEPPHRWVVETEEGPGTVATEWIVEARSGGTCVVRVVHSWFASGDDWDGEFEGHAMGWRAFFRILRLYLTHFRGAPAASVQLMATSDESESRSWKRLVEGLGFAGAGVGDRREAAAGAPSFAGKVEAMGTGHHRELLLRMESPVPGIAHVFAMSMGGQVLLPLRMYLYGDDAADVAALIEPEWNRWLGELFGKAVEA